MKKISVVLKAEAAVFILAMTLTILPFSLHPIFAQEEIGVPDQAEEQVDLSPTAEFKEYDVLDNADIGEGNVTVFKPESNIIERQIDQAQPSAVIQTEYIDTYEYREPEVQNVQPEFKAIEPVEQAGPSAAIQTENIEEYKYEEPATEGLFEGQDYGMEEGE